MSDSPQDSLSWAKDVVGAATLGPWFPSIEPEAFDVYSDCGTVVASVRDIDDTAAIVLLGSVGRDMLAVVEATDRYVEAREARTHIGAIASRIADLMTARKKLAAALAAARERAGR